ncbi:type II toxin-antitoxin system Phd/YefM family antitoxin [Oculatella sp. FACHB-28]|uniref:type II toxin-antitoxin system Phd/YefM family antitoxin n=1 Tax=Oculatella sp. FACHB-28 TaxID=2692845 RepID=UPI001683DB7F|nr:type II toxin-antitoxin system Phd/YefM family antitoxin [Oculatella sp. FACHB-28]MBD1867273.1 type II toxin-antitoxin system Phd/YefM family antitoxin [Cyanobacteria bacterium FACHB-471]MBD2059061.1 type II toxin-antitoxin system Phd/YefM family antitoxin [Oculatella sp. FACHB-28]
MSDLSVQYSIVQASDRLPELVDQAEQGTPIELTRHGKRVAVILSAEEYDRMFSQKGDFGRSLAAFRHRLEVENIDIDPDEVFKDVRDKFPGREVNL